VLELLRRQRALGAVLLAVLLPVVVYRAHAAREGAHNPLDRLVLFVSAPVERFLSSMVVRCHRLVLYVDVRGARGENIELRRKLLEAGRQAASLEGLEAENRRLRLALELSEKNPELHLLAASVVALSASPAEQIVRVDRGLSHGARRGMAVISPAGRVGRIQRIGYGYSEILLISDEKASLDVMIGRTRVRGRLKGAGLWPEVSLKVLHVLRTEDVRAGDVVLCSGLSGLYPRGVVVGRVKKVDASPDGQELQVEVSPSVDFSRLEDVQIVLGPGAPGEPLATPEILLPPALLPGGTDTATPAEARPVGPPAIVVPRPVGPSPTPKAAPGRRVERSDRARGRVHHADNGPGRACDPRAQAERGARPKLLDHHHRRRDSAMIRRALVTWGLTWFLLVLYTTVARRLGLFLDVPSLVVTYLALERGVIPGAIMALGVGYLGDIFSGTARGHLASTAVLVFLVVRLGVSKFSGARWVLVSVVGVLTVLLSQALSLLVEGLVGPGRFTLHAEAPALLKLVLANLFLSYPLHRLLRLVDERIFRPEDDLVFRS
jgi:rod shape-determining protein MreC